MGYEWLVRLVRPMNTTSRILGEAIGDNPSGFDPNMGVTELIMSTFPKSMPLPPVRVHLPGHSTHIRRVEAHLRHMFPDKTEVIGNAFRRIGDDYSAAMNNHDYTWSNPNIPQTYVGYHAFLNAEQRAKRYALFREQLIPELVELAKDLDYPDYLQWAMANNQDVSWI